MKFLHKNGIEKRLFTEIHYTDEEKIKYNLNLVKR